MLFALTCPERISSLARLDLRYERSHPEGATFSLTLPRKTGVSDKAADAFFAYFKQNSLLCPVECLRHFLKVTRNLRPAVSSSEPKYLLISFIRPQKPVTSTTLGRWLRSVMQNAGIDSQMFKAHSVRGASNTAAANAFIPVTIMSMDDWSSPSTFKTFYYKPTLNTEYAAGVLSSTV